MKTIPENSSDNNHAGLADMCFKGASVCAREAINNDSTPAKLINGALAGTMGALGAVSWGVGKALAVAGSAVTSGTAAMANSAADNHVISKDAVIPIATVAGTVLTGVAAWMVASGPGDVPPPHA